MPSVQATLDFLRQQISFMENVASWEQLPAQSARHGHTPDGLDSRLVEALRRHLGTNSRMNLLYTHQAHAVKASLRGENVVVVSGTASGKTLCYNLPVLHALLHDSAARALYLLPTKALAQDQAIELEALINHLSVSDRPAVRTYDGDTPHSQRRTIRREARILITNPDMLHTAMLPHHTRWVSLLSKLTYVVLDEVHTYRGVFGSHIANVLRRLRRICEFHGASPQFVCASATIANPKELSETLIGEQVVLVEDDGAPRAPKHFIVYNPPLVDPHLGIRRAYTLETAKVAARFIEDDVQTIIFARARATTELLLGYVRDQAARQGVDESVIRGYRGGYLPSERREIELGLRTGTVRAVVATNALEVGIDIGQLGTAVIAGYPGTIASLWQQAGRAGRRSDVSAVVFVASGAPLDQYIVLHPRYIFESSPEHGLINPDNLAILVSHLRCALFELPFATGDSFGGIEHVEEFLQILAEHGEVHISAQAAHWIGESYPAADISLRTTRTANVLIQDVSESNPRIIGEVDLEAAPMLSHPSAIYMHEGKQYLVDNLDWEAQVADVRPVEVDYYTRASEATELNVLSVFETDKTRPACLGHGEVLVTTQPTHFRRIKRYTHEVLGYGEIDLPRREFETTAYWLWIERKTVLRLEREGFSLSPNDYGPNWQRQRARVRAMADHRCQQCGAPEIRSETVDGVRQHDVHHVRPFREFGYISGQNQNYQEANATDNLRLLCRRCHHRTEANQGNHTALGGIAHGLTNLAPLHLMCDPRDITAIAELRGKETNAPTITIFERVAGGIGLSERLYEVSRELLAGVHEMIYSCPCTQGCPACIGPVVSTKERLVSLKKLTLRLAEVLL